MSVVNFGTEPVEVQASVVHWDLDERNEVRTIAPTEQSLDQWIVINPLRFTVPAGRDRRPSVSRCDRVSSPRRGEHRAMIYLHASSSSPNSEQQVRVRFRVGVADLRTGR